MNRYLKATKLALTLLVLGFFPLSGVRSGMIVDITQGQVAPTPIAIAPLFGDTAVLSELGKQISDVVAADLERSGLFMPIDPRAFVQDMTSLREAPRFSDWRVINAQLLVKGALVTGDDGSIRFEFRLFDVLTEKQMEGLAFVGNMQNWRRIAHKIADAIYRRVTGEEGYFDTQIVYVAETGSLKKRVKRLAVMDQDGANLRYLTNGRTLVLTPRFSPNMQQITYLDFAPGKAMVYLMDLNSGKSRLLGGFPGMMTIAPRFSPDGQSMIVSASRDGNTNLYLLRLDTNAILRLTSDPVIDTSPSFAPDGSRICFNSDRSGKTEIYVMPVTGGSAERISFGEGSYRTPVWSPRGDLIAFTKMLGGYFFIGVMKPDGSDERLLVRAWGAEDPSWAPNGRVIVYTRREANGTSRICTIDLSGHNEREIPTPTDASGPTWSPLIP